MTKLIEVLDKHKQWLDSDGELGERADLRGAYLMGTNLTGSNLAGAYLTGSNLTCADLRGADLKGADLEGSDLTGAILIGANLIRVNLRGSDLTGADLGIANLIDADLRGANLRGADLIDTNLIGIKVNEHTLGYHLVCPEEGSFIGFKKCRNNTIVELLIPEDVKRSSATTRKCRASKAIVLDITNENGEQIDSAVSIHDSNFIYNIGETVEVECFDDNRWKECSTGIHFFITRGEAEDY